jgi:hypothetical protein
MYTEKKWKRKQTNERLQAVWANSNTISHLRNSTERWTTVQYNDFKILIYLIDWLRKICEIPRTKNM